MPTKQEILSYLKTNKELYFKQFDIVKIGIFGSFARNEQTEKSDIDIIIDMPRNTENIFDKRLALQESISHHCALPVDVCHVRAIKPIFKELILKDVIYA